jgi:Tfp pilus assembly protein PilF
VQKGGWRRFAGSLHAIDLVAGAARRRSRSSHAGRAVAYLRKGNVDRALPDLNEGLRLDPKHSGGRGYHYNKKGDYERALTEVNEALRATPTTPTALQ